MASPLSAREAAWQALRRGCDVLVIGGGITGAGVALDAALRGYSVVLVERCDFAGGTSSRSTKLVHGGLRYLPQMQFGLVREALVERERLRRLAPALVRPLGFVVPLYADTRRPLGLRIPGPVRPLTTMAMGAGLWAYDLLSRTDLPHRRLGREEALALAPSLRVQDLRSAFLYTDAQTDDVRLTLAVLAAARAHGAVTLNYAEVTGIETNPPRAAVVDRIGSAAAQAAARHIVNAAGIWAEQVAALAGPVPFRIERSKGTHLVLDAPELLRDAALVIPETDDGRLAFAVPWRGRVLLGTTDEATAGDPDAPRAEAREARYLLDHLNRYLSKPVDRGVVISAYAGLRPLVRRGRGSSAALSRSHEVVEHPGPMVSIIGGKLTTYRQMAEDTVDVLVRRDGRRAPSTTASTPLPAPSGIEELRAHVVHAVREEQCVRLTDFMVARRALALLERDHGLAAVDEVAAVMARELGWTSEQTGREIEMYRGRVAAETAFLREL